MVRIKAIAKEKPIILIFAARRYPKEEGNNRVRKIPITAPPFAPEKVFPKRWPSREI
jgi:hypothetical protein